MRSIADLLSVFKLISEEASSFITTERSVSGFKLTVHNMHNFFFFFFFTLILPVLQSFADLHPFAKLLKTLC